LPNGNETISLPVSGGDNDLVSCRRFFSEVRAYSQTLDMMLADLKPMTITG
jgi:hypothetical protein